MIAVYAQHGLAQLALDLFTLMEQENMKPDKITFVNVLNVCASAEALAIGRQIHARIIQSGFESDVVVATSLIKMYAKCRSLEDARKVFDKIPESDVIAWSAIIAAYTQQGQGLSALKLFEEMQRQHVKPNEITFVALLDACASFSGLAEGKLIHSYLLKYGYESDLFVINSLINMYSKCGCMDDACKIFEGMPKRNLVSWNVMIAGYSQSGQTKSALLLFEHMQREGFKPDKYTYVSIFDACANLAFLPDGKAIHSRIGSFKDDLNPEVGNALLNMYGKCGNIDEALNIFVRMFERDVVAWTSMISAYSQHGHGQFAIQLFAQMQEVGIELNDITIASILSGCSHSGLVDEGSHYFDSFSKRFHKLMTPVCYGSMVDLLGRAGHLAEAENLVCTMPFHPNVVIWMTLLASCRAFGDMERGKRAAKHILELDPQNSAAYVVLSDVHAAVCQ
ncbi:hypothetical protein O6H91_21G067400 [Diphasiastrum complanatum]|nr:hypothetical protein O6H91_21G067400 [Diphasiastrum complanatum]